MIQVIFGLVLCALWILALSKEFKQACDDERKLNEAIDALYINDYNMLLASRKDWQKNKIRRG